VRNETLPAEFVANELVQWINGFDTLERPRTREEMASKKASADGRLLRTCAGVMLEEACTFCFASLYHIGRISQTSSYSRQMISRLKKKKNLVRSSEQFAKRTATKGHSSAYSLSQLCESELRFHSSRIDFAAELWRIWLQRVEVLKFLMTKASGLTTNEWLASLDATGAVFIICSRGAKELLDGMGEDSTQFRALPTPQLAGFLDALEIAHNSFYAFISEELYWEQSEEKAWKIERQQRLRSPEAVPEIHKDKDIDRTSEVQWTKHSARRLRVAGRRIGRPFSERLLSKCTKYFITSSRKPPLWKSVSAVAKQLSVAHALSEAAVEPAVVINNFADELIQFSAGIGNGTLYLPYGEDDWNKYVDVFFNSVWVPNLHQQNMGQLSSLSGPKMTSFVEASAALLNSMGYRVTFGSNLPISSQGMHGKDEVNARRSILFE
jgi:hypothetical protein